jgi:hypothetical protein
MKRKKFLIISAVAVAAVAVPVAIKLRDHKKVRNRPMEEPRILGNFCNDEDIREIGMDYRKRVPDEAEKQKLVELLLKNDSGKKINSTDIHEVSDWLDEKTDQEFKADNTLIVAGWVVSVTEARQCALYSLS